MVLLSDLLDNRENFEDFPVAKFIRGIFVIYIHAYINYYIKSIKNNIYIFFYYVNLKINITHFNNYYNINSHLYKIYLWLLVYMYGLCLIGYKCSVLIIDSQIELLL